MNVMHKQASPIKNNEFTVDIQQQEKLIWKD